MNHNYEYFDLVPPHNPYFQEYRKVQNYMPNKPSCKAVRANMWETRLPSLVKQRYSYNDYHNTNIKSNYFTGYPANFTDKAQLLDLPLDLKNRYKATINANDVDYLTLVDMMSNDDPVSHKVLKGHSDDQSGTLYGRQISGFDYLGDYDGYTEKIEQCIA